MLPNEENNDFLERAAKHNSKKKISSLSWVIIIILFFLAYGIIREAIHFANSTHKGWSSNNTNEIYSSLKEGIKSMPMDSSSQKNLINCVISKLKSKYPEGLAEVNDDSLKNTTAKFITACGNESNINLGWSQTVDSILRVRLIATPFIKALPEVYKKRFCDCYIDRIKELYPNGLTETLRRSTMDSINTACSQKIIK